ncbi:hypothetical protein HK096_010198 [Nowakowskiella sp. JEL0078]|nr:hypothetical protein HK096_010198 [Nowakowskiella sp. JEL0078]
MRKILNQHEMIQNGNKISQEKCDSDLTILTKLQKSITQSTDLQHSSTSFSSESESIPLISKPTLIESLAIPGLSTYVPEGLSNANGGLLDLGGIGGLGGLGGSNAHQFLQYQGYHQQDSEMDTSESGAQKHIGMTGNWQ